MRLLSIKRTHQVYNLHQAVMNHPFSSFGWSEFHQTSSQDCEAILVVHALQWDHSFLIVLLQPWFPLDDPWPLLRMPSVSDHSSRGYEKIFPYFPYVLCFCVSCPCSFLSCAYFSLSCYQSCAVVFQIGAITHQNNHLKQSRRRKHQTCQPCLTNKMQPFKRVDIPVVKEYFIWTQIIINSK